jgi:phosphatidylinositol alpha-mannosyltransferase
MRIGIVCPYDWSVPGGVKQHIQDLSESLIDLGHYVNVLTPTSDEDSLPIWATSAGSTIALPYNGSIARIKFDPAAFTRTRNWLRAGQFDILHLHEPISPSPSIIAAWSARGPIVATHHTSNDSMYAVKNMQFLLQPMMEKVIARIAVSEEAKKTMIDHLGGDAVVIPNGVRVSNFIHAEVLPGFNKENTVVFVGRLDEPRKGIQVLLKAMPKVFDKFPKLKLLLVGPGDEAEILKDLDTEYHSRIEFKGYVASALKASCYASASVYVAPNLGGESFGIVLLEAMASGTPVLASDLPAFRKVLNEGEFGYLFKTNDEQDLATKLIELLDSAEKRKNFQDKGFIRANQYDWSVIVRQIMDVYDSVKSVEGRIVREDFKGQLYGRLTKTGRLDRIRVKKSILPE